MKNILMDLNSSFLHKAVQCLQYIFKIWRLLTKNSWDIVLGFFNIELMYTLIDYVMVLIGMSGSDYFYKMFFICLLFHPGQLMMQIKKYIKIHIISNLCDYN